jgi:mRNA degradation ribonuclease J1/J2
MRLDHQRIKRWLMHFGLLGKLGKWNVTHVSGHGSMDQIRHVVEETHAKNLIPIHTVHDEYFKKWHGNVTTTSIGKSVEL